MGLPGKYSMNIIDYIYALVETESKVKFYIGRTEDPKRRIKEHRYGSRTYKEGDEDKYLYASQLDALGIKWEMVILMECGPDTEFYEDYFVNLYRNEPLQNMRAGDSEPWMGRDYRNPDEFLQEKKRIIEAAKIKVPKVKKVYDSDPARTLFIGEKPEQKFISPAMKAILARREEEKLQKKVS